ncbi:PH and SEC7 domain-containing protein 4 isoform X1 [Meriones unguiculatus]|uniref:PH and SEC7 domain-containing protein 4 isoform X1 n=1 Tax=Meriones unguiculatus TaxID=10047 RepID=UPI000B4EF52B|nr:PH and SEC7 domain-containing protein 4 isoform X1 [Meriones unguiculatus]XP_021518673.1 PH and SEC7 domain-containing protein 4 isoform X1 [Meriones unguiculatus]XP_021518674.1 PH and SEC7 domain-containing protein 4 isoform X1 [Meriones unguiculatus]XP_021518675.1 PH and SEC7 domain-containing protein 4 isoform X1 [Meriones unguiculatus]XP_021518676.1 PH and SEC7 domain-containing protein 4 isoform X1 [Meriones unguiculatus]XP_060245655.1 PH and SEC7 domain-containing protein 4 isoform X1
MMGDNRPLDHLRHMEFLNICLEDNLQPCPGTCPSEICSHPGPDEPCQEYAWPFDPPQSTRPDAHHGNSGMEPTRLEDCSFQGEARKTPASLRSVGDSCPLGSPQQNQSSSTQVVFWAGILQAQMCVLDLEEELEKTEGLRAELRCCIPPSSKDFLGDVDLSPSLPTADEDPEDDSSGPEEENQTWPKGQMPGSSPEWGAEEDSIFFDNPLFLESPCSDTSAEGECFSWGYPDGKTWPHSPETLDSPLQEGTGLWRPGSELCLGSNTADHGGCTTPPFPVPPYKMHPCMALGSTEEAPTVPLDQKGEDSQTPQSLSDLAPPILENLQTEDSSWPQELLISQNRGERDAGCFQEPMPCTLAPWGSQVSHLESGSPETEGRGSGPRPSPVSSQEGGSQVQLCNLKWPKDASHPSLLEKDELELSSLKKEETAEVPNLRQEVEYEDTARTEEAPAAQHQVHLTSAEGLPESLMPQAQSPEEFRRPSSGNKLANNIRNDKGAWNLALRLYQLNGFRKSEVAAHLQKNNDFSRAVAEAYLSFFHFEGQSLDRALRGFLQALVLSGETQERERILYQFSKRFHYCNPGAFPSVDSIHTLTCAIMLLNTDLHGQNIGKSMSCQEFITNLNGLQDGGNFPKELLKALYWSIRSEKLEWAVDEEDAARPEKDQPCASAGKISSPFLQMAHDPTMPTYKQGILARKMHHDADGKKTPWGKRGWKMFHTLLRGMALYFLKGEGHWLDGESLVGHMVDEPVGVHHSLASPATHYTKKPHVFQLRTADWRLYLFQAPTAKEMASWIARINLAAATHSAPPFPAAVGSQRRFVRPILPMSPAQSSLEEQHRSHENCLDAASDDLLDLQRKLPERRGRSRELEEYRLRKEYLEHEKTRYETYVQLLVARLHFPLGDLAMWEDQLGKEAEGTQDSKPSLKKSHSSPSLHQDEAPTTAKVKRNISERRTYRKIIPKRNRNQL